MNTKEKINKILQITFHPAIIPLVALYLLFNSNNYLSSLIPQAFRLNLYLFTLIITILIPAALYYAVRLFYEPVKKGQKENKTVSYMIFVISNLTAFYLFTTLSQNIPVFIPLIFLTAAIVAVIMLLISFAIDISLQMIALGAITAFITLISILFKTDLLYYILSILTISGIVGTLLLFTKKHNEIHIFTGFSFSFFSTILIFVLVTLL